MTNLDPKFFELPSTLILQKASDDLVVIVNIRKSRIIMEDGERFLKYVNKIKAKMPYTNVLIKTTAPVCSKTEKYLLEHGIKIESSQIIF
jgi:hypothetical protein